MGRVTNEERREVARNIRNADLTKYASYYEEVKGWDHVRATRFVLVSNLGSAIGIEKAIFSIDDLKIRLADLIEPDQDDIADTNKMVDRDALLDIARQMEWASEASYEEVGVVSGGIVGAWAEKIKEACGIHD